MTEKFDRQFSLKVEIQPRGKDEAPPTARDRWVEITQPLTVEFHICRSLMGSANTANFRILNLASRSRNQIYKDRYNFTDYRACQFWAGYGGRLYQCFNGNVIAAWSKRDSGSTETVTEVQAQESYAMVNAFTNRSIAQTGYRDALMQISKDFLHMDEPIIGNIQGESARTLALYGPSIKLLQQYAGDATVTIDNNRLLVLRPNETIKGDIAEVSSETGLLGSPYRSQFLVEAEMLFTPELKVGQFLQLKSTVNPIFNKVPYRVIGFQHSGVISGAVCGTARTLVQLQTGQGEFFVV